MMIKINDFLNSILEKLLMIFTASMLIIITYQVFGRYVLNSSPSWTEEVARIILVWISMLGASLLVRHRKNINITFLIDNALPVMVRHILDLVIDLTTLMFAMLILYLGIKHSIKNVSYFTEALHLPMLILTGAMPIGSFFMVIFSLENTLIEIRKFKGVKS